MTATTTLPAGAAPGVRPRRAVLIDFDWSDADLIPQLVRQPGLSVRLVAAERTESPGLRIAEMCGLPRTVDLADLTREIFDVALVSERSNRRTQVEGLLLALGTPSATPQSYLTGFGPDASSEPAIEAPLALHAAAFENAIGGEAFSAIVEQALPDLADGAPTTPIPVVPQGLGRVVIRSLDDFPSPEDRLGLENALREIVRQSGADGAELYAGKSEDVALVAQVGEQDPLLKGLVDLALKLGEPQVVRRVSGPAQGKLWGAWPFRTTQHHGVLAAAAIDPKRGCSEWEGMLEDLRSRWDRKDRDLAAPAFPMMPESRPEWLDPNAFAECLELAVERNARDGMRFAVHRLEFADAPTALQAMVVRLPGQVRDTDSICRPSARELLILTAGPAVGFLHLRRRLLALWEQSWHEGRLAPPPPPVVEQQVEMQSPEEAAAFLANARLWLGVER